MSIVLLTRQGFRKCSDILLLALAVADVLLLCGINNFVYFLSSKGTFGLYTYSESINYMCYILSTICCGFYILGLHSAALIPVLITGERILAIFYPFKANAIVTPKCTLAVLSCIYCLSAMYFVYNFIFCRQFVQFVVHDVIMGTIIYTEVFYDHNSSGLYWIIENTTFFTTTVIPVGLVILGCLVIGFRILQITKTRETLTCNHVNVSTKPGTLKTTKTLLCICILYIFCNGFFLTIVNEELFKLQTEQRSIMIVLTCVQDMAFCINCIGDFLIYVGTNRRFRKSVL